MPIATRDASSDVLNVALTGNVASGKSTVLRWFADWGATVIDADQLVREVEAPGTPTLAAIARRFGPEMLCADGSLDRAALRQRVFGDPESLADLNAIVHPAVRRLRDARAARARAEGVRILVNDIPLLFETLDPAAFDLVVLVDAPVALRRERLERDRGLSAEEAERMIGSQLPADTKRAQSDIVIENAGSLDALKTAARAAWERMVQRA